METNWINLPELGLQGAGWSKPGHPFDRLPAHAEGVVTEAVWNLGRQSAGLWVDFRSDAESLHARTALREPPAEGQGYIRYLDLYCRDESGAWRWAGVSRYGFLPSGETPLIEGLAQKQREWRLYLPLTYAVESIELGIPAGAQIEAVPADPRPPVVIYGTSIVHGCGHPSRPGMVWPSIVSRRLDWPIINLGFSGSARMEPPLAHILAELNPAVFVVDPLPNMSSVLVKENAQTFMRTLFEAHPRTPIVLIEDRTHADAWLRPDYFTEQAAKRVAFRAVAEDLREQGALVTYVNGDDLIGHDSDGTTDGSHPTDLGTTRYADCIGPVLGRLLDQE